MTVSLYLYKRHRSVILTIYLIFTLCLLDFCHVDSAKISSLKSSIFNNFTKTDNKTNKQLSKGIFNSVRSSDNLFEDTKDGDSKLYSKIFKNQIYDDIKSSEDVLRSLCIRVIDHSVDYLGAIVSRTMTGLAIVNPINIGCNNLLSTKLDDPYASDFFGVDKGADPKTFGHDYLHVVIPSPSRNVTLDGWLIKSKKKNCDSVYLLFHGWHGNIQSCLPFLNALTKSGELDKSHVLIVNLNKSENHDSNFATNIGVRGAIDIYDSLNFVKNSLNVKSVSLYGQSVSCLSILLYLKLKYLFEKSKAEQKLLSKCGGLRDFNYKKIDDLKIEKVILESPVSNIKSIITRGLPKTDKKFGWFMNQFVSLLDKRLGGHVGMMRLKYLLNYASDVPVYILQGKKDYISTNEDLYHEIATQDYPQIKKLYLFESGKHGDLSKSKHYNDTVKDITKGRSLFQLIFMLKPTTQVSKNQLL